MKSRTRFAVLVAGATLLASACSSANVAATVDGVDITDDDVLALRTTEYGLTVPGDGFRGDLTTLISLRAQVAAADEDFGITGLDTPSAQEEWRAEADADELDVLASIEGNEELSEYALDAVTLQLMLRDDVSAMLLRDDEFLHTVWDQNQTALVEVCPRHILVMTQEEALAAYDRIAAGEDFGTVADEVSLDTLSPGGQLDCPSSPADFVSSFGAVVAGAPIGEVTEPFQSEVGWHIVLVDSRDAPESFDAFAADAERWVPSAILDAEWNEWRDDALGRADVAVRSQIGSWFAQGDGILPPPVSPK